MEISEIKDLIESNRIEEAIKALRTATEQDADLRQQVGILAARFHQFKRDETTILSSEERFNQSSKITKALLEICDQLQKPATEKQGSMESERPKNEAPLLDQHFAGKYAGTALLFGAAAFIILILLSIALPDWTGDNPFLFKTLLALSAASIAAMLPGFLHLDLNNVVKAGGALGVFALVYFLNPGLEAKAPFDLIVNLHDAQGPHSNILKNQGTLELELLEKDYRSTAAIDADGTARFEDIPAEYRRASARFQLIDNFHKITDPARKYKLNTEMIDLEIAPKLIEQIFGRVLDDQFGIPGVEISLGDDPNLKAHTNSSGEFAISIPAELQKHRFTLTAGKEEYQYTENQPAFQEEIDAYEAESQINIRLEKINTPSSIELVTDGGNPPPAPVSQVEETNIINVHLTLRYNQKDIEFTFPAQHRVSYLINYIVNGPGRDYIDMRARCDIERSGELLPRDKTLSELNITNLNGRISLRCNNESIPIMKTEHIVIRGLSIKPSLVFVNGVYSQMERNNRGEIVGSTTGLVDFKGEHVIIIDNQQQRKRISLKGIKIPENLGDYSRLVFMVSGDGRVEVIGE